MYRPTAKGYFTGAGGMEIGLMQAGVNVIQSLEIDQQAVNCMLANPKYFGHSVLKQDIEQITVFEQPGTDMIIGTYPCTKYSAIADIHGTRTGDNLFLHFFRHIALERPEMYIIENVPGMKKFKVVMEAMTKLPEYYVNVFCPVDAANWLPQKRKRLILIGTRKPFFIQAPTAVNNRPRLKDVMEVNPEVDMPDYVLSRIAGKYRDHPIIVDPELAGTIDSNVIIWHHLEAERQVLEQAFKGENVASVYGSLPNEEKEKLLIGFSEGEHKYLLTKPKIAGSGCNLQGFCNHMIFAGIDYKFNDFIQAIHRCYRFGQTLPVYVHLVYTDNEYEVMKTLREKWANHLELNKEMVALVKEYGLNTNLIKSQMERQMFAGGKKIVYDNATLYNNDTVIVHADADEMPDNGGACRRLDI